MSMTTVPSELAREDMRLVEHLGEQVHELLSDAYRKLVAAEELIAAERLAKRGDDPLFGRQARVLVGEMRQVESRPVLTAALAADDLRRAAESAWETESDAAHPEAGGEA
jgi:ribosomal 50S subunit-associated protein YjgA (DUF615 family)